MELPIQLERVCTTVCALEHYPFCFSLWDLCICLDCKFAGFTFNCYATLPLPLDFVDSLVLWIYKSVSVLFVCLFLIWFSGSTYQFSSVQFSCSVMSDSLWPYGLQHTRPPCPSPTPRVYSDSFCIESVMPSNHLNLCCPLLLPLQSFPVSRYFQMSQFFASGGQSISISPSNAYSGLISFRMDWLDLLAVQGTLKSVLQDHSSKASVSVLSFLYSPTLTCIRDYWKNHSFD